MTRVDSHLLGVDGAELQNLEWEGLAADPSGPELRAGRHWFNLTDGYSKYYDGTEIQPYPGLPPTIHDGGDAGGAVDPDPFIEAVNPDPALYDFGFVSNVGPNAYVQWYQAQTTEVGFRWVLIDSAPVGTLGRTSVVPGIAGVGVPTAIGVTRVNAITPSSTLTDALGAIAELSDKVAELSAQLTA